jgi:DNA-binding protein Fis
VLEVKGWLLEHLDDHYGLYGEFAGVRSARKHIGWTLRGLPGGEAFRSDMNTIESCDEQSRAVASWFDRLADSPAADAGAPAPDAAADAVPLTRDGHDHQEAHRGVRRESLESYFKDLRGVEPAAMYEMICAWSSGRCSRVVMREAGGNQSRRRRVAGQSTATTLRRKLVEHKLIK